MQNILQELKNDKNIISKIKNGKNETCAINQYIKQKENFYLNSEIYKEHEMLESIKKSYLNSKEIKFIDEIFFSDLNSLCIL